MSNVFSIIREIPKSPNNNKRIQVWVKPAPFILIPACLERTLPFKTASSSHLISPSISTWNCFKWELSTFRWSNVSQCRRFFPFNKIILKDLPKQMQRAMFPWRYRLMLVQTWFPWIRRQGPQNLKILCPVKILFMFREVVAKLSWWSKAVASRK